MFYRLILMESNFPNFPNGCDYNSWILSISPVINFDGKDK